MPRRHGWLQDYMYNLDQSEPRNLRDPGSLKPDPRMQIGPIPHEPEIDVEEDDDDVVVPPVKPQRVQQTVQQPSPVTVNVNINLGDILDRISNGRVSAREALKEMTNRPSKKKRLNG